MDKLNVNDYIALENILSNNKISRTDIAKILNITNAGVYKIINKLKDLNLLEKEEEIKAIKLGRPRNTLKINKKYKKIIGIYIGDKYIDISVSYLNGEIIQSRRRVRTNKLLHSKTPKIVLDEILNFVKEYKKQNIIAIGLSVCGIVNSKNGIVTSSTAFTIKNFNIKSIIEDTFKIPCIVWNSIDAMISAEKLFGNLKGIENSLFIYKKEQIAISAMINNKVYTKLNFNPYKQEDYDIYKAVEAFMDILQLNNLLICGDNIFHDSNLNIITSKFPNEIEKLSPIAIIMENLFKGEKLI